MMDHANARASLRAAVQPHVPNQVVDEVIDLTMHAVQESKHALIRVASGASSDKVRLCVIGIAVSVTITELQNLQEKLEKEAKSQGMTPRNVEVTL